jgi:hypothetical protein
MSPPTQIVSVLVRPIVRPGAYDQHIAHDDPLRTVDDVTGARPTGRSAEADAIAGIWLPASPGRAATGSATW